MPTNITTDNGIFTLNTIRDLKAYEPTASGEVVLVREYNAGTGVGGGLFISDVTDSSTPDDKGINIHTTGKKLWKRRIDDYNLINVTHFGAVPDGKTDCADAVLNMWYWSRVQTNSLALYQNIGIRFPAGRFMISKFDVSKNDEIPVFRLAGEPVKFGYFPTTTLVSDKEDGGVMFNINARRTEITGLIIDGESDKKNGPLNTKGFYKNSLSKGQYLRVSSVHFINLGGRGLDVRDTLDCKIDQWYANGCQAPVIYARPSGEDSWDHITAIELSNFNVQYGYDENMLDLPRATQSLIRNGWIEHTEFPGDLSNGQWEIEALSLEDNTNALICHHTRLVSTQLNLQSGSKIDTAEEGDEWLSVYERGQTYIENHGIRVGSLNFNYITSQEYMDNSKPDKPNWFLLGEVEIEEWTTIVEIKLVGTSRADVMDGTQRDFDAKTPEGSATLSLQNVSGTVQGSWSAEGSSPVTAVYIERTGSSKVKIYLKIAARAGFVKALLTTNSPDRFLKPTCFRFIKSYTQVDDATAASLDGEPEKWCYMQHWSGNDSVGFGYNNDNELLFHAPVVDDNQMIVRVNGKKYAIALTPQAN